MEDGASHPPISRWISQAGFDALPMPGYIYRPDGLLVAGNAAAEAFWRLPNTALINNFNLVESGELIGREVVATFQQVVREGTPHRGDATLMEYDNETELPIEGQFRVWLQVYYMPLRDEHGVVHYVMGMGLDVTEQMERAQEIERAEAQIAAQQETISTLEAAKDEIQRQRATIAELSSPIIDVWSGVVLVPLVGAIDRERTDVLVDRLLNAISGRQARFTIIDLTGVPEIDSGSANLVLRVCSMVSLLGAECVLAGIQPPVAETITALDVNLGAVRVFRTLRDALKHCMRR